MDLGNIVNRSTSTPPGSPAAGDAYIVLATGLAAWSGHDGEYALWSGYDWHFRTIIEGDCAWDVALNQALLHDGTSLRVSEDATGAVLKSGVDAKGDLVVGTADNAVTRIAAPSDGTVRLADSSQATGWAAAGIAPLNKTTFAAKGDLISASAVSTPAALTVGANDKVLMAASGETTGLKWEFNVRDRSSFRHAGGHSLEAWYIANADSAFALTTGAPSANVLRALPFVAPARGGTLDRLGYLITSSVAGNTRIGLYENTSDTDLYPAALLNDSGNIANSNAVKTYTLSRALTPGKLYWLAIVSDANSTVRALALASCSGILGSDNTFGTALNAGISVAHAFAALPDPFTTGGAMIAAVPVPALYYRFSA